MAAVNELNQAAHDELTEKKKTLEYSEAEADKRVKGEKSGRLFLTWHTSKSSITIFVQTFSVFCNSHHGNE